MGDMYDDMVQVPRSALRKVEAERDALQSQLRARDEALRVARAAVKEAQKGLEAVFDFWGNDAHDDEDCPQDDTCECEDVKAYNVTEQALKDALAAISEATDAP